ncbi:hypothetical protein IC582_011215 [Cucumis melo]
MLLHAVLPTTYLLDYKRNTYTKADLQCTNVIQSMEKRLRVACLMQISIMLWRLALPLVVLILAHELKIEDANASLFEAKFHLKLLSFKLL